MPKLTKLTRKAFIQARPLGEGTLFDAEASPAMSELSKNDDVIAHR